jgi:predicted permease
MFVFATAILAAVVVIVLLIACSNVANLLLSRTAAREGEMAVRVALGASRGRLVRQLLTESVVLSLVGGMFGVLLAWVCLGLLVANIPMSLPENAPVAINTTVLTFAIVLSMTTGLAFGAVPALSLSRVSLRAALTNGGHRHGSGLSRRAGQVLVAAEVTLAIVLMVSAGLMIRSFARVLAVDVGFDASAFTTLEVTPVDQRAESLRRYYPALIDTLRQRPGMQAVGAIDHLPLQGSIMKTAVRANGKAVQSTPNIHQFLPGAFEALGFSLKQGRWPNDADMRQGLPVAVLSESAARQMFPNSNAIGQEIGVGPRKSGATFQVIAVVGDVRHRGPLREVEPDLYIAWGHLFQPEPLMIVARSRNSVGELREAAQAGAERAVVERIRGGDEWYSERVATPRKRMMLLGMFGGVGFALVLVGVFGVTAYAVTQRTKEIGVRMAFGADAGDVVKHVVSDALAPLALGVAAGLAGASVATDVMKSLLFETDPTDPATFAGAAIILAVAALLASWLPARRAARVDPLVALRYE